MSKRGGERIMREPKGEFHKRNERGREGEGGGAVEGKREHPLFLFLSLSLSLFLLLRNKPIIKFVSKGTDLG